MFWVIVFPVLVIIVVIAWWLQENRSYRSWIDLFGGIVFGGLLGGIAGILVGLAAGAFVGEDQTIEVVEEVVEIRAMSDGTHTDGSFYLFGGSIDSEPVYSYFYMDGEGFRKGWVPADDALVIEESETQPRLVTREYHNVDGFWYLGAGAPDSEYVFYVPPGTVTNKFNLDLED